MAEKSSSSNTLLIANIILALIIGVLLWFLLLRGDGGLPTLGGSSQPDTLSTKGLSEQDLKEIADIQTRLELEKARAQQAREKMRARELEAALQAERQKVSQPSEVNSESGLDVSSEKTRIQAMIDAQLQGANEKNQQLAAALEAKENQLSSLKQQNIALSQRLRELDSDAASLMESLLSETPENIAEEDQDYLQALQGDVSAFVDDAGQEALARAESGEADLINQITISDSGQGSDIASTLKTRVDKLMEKDNERATANAMESNVIVEDTIVAANTRDAATSLQARIDKLMQQSQQSEKKQQINANQQYLESLDPLAAERKNETRWVTVKRGDTLWEIAERAYHDGWQYPRIFDANPQVLSNPDRISPGQRLRVPL